MPIRNYFLASRVLNNFGRRINSAQSFRSRRIIIDGKHWWNGHQISLILSHLTIPLLPFHSPRWIRWVGSAGSSPWNPKEPLFRARRNRHMPLLQRSPIGSEPTRLSKGCQRRLGWGYSRFYPFCRSLIVNASYNELSQTNLMKDGQFTVQRTIYKK